MSKHKKNKKRQAADNKPFDVGAYELFNINCISPMLYQTKRKLSSGNEKRWIYRTVWKYGERMINLISFLLFFSGFLTFLLRVS